MYDAIDVRRRRNNYDCTLTSRPNTDNTDVERLQLATFNKSHAVTRQRQPSPAVYETERR